ncbi:MAG: DciA family protein [Actinomycetota bacterium]
MLDVLGAERRLGAGLLLGALGRGWEAVVGLRLAEESAPVSLEGGVLLVRASSSAWAAQIRFLSKEIAEGANRVLAGGSGEGGGRAGSRPKPQEETQKAPIREVRVVVDPGRRTP